MDIGAYARIEDLSAILASTGINIPRLRGLRLMATEEKISEDEIKEMTNSAEVDAVEDLVRACPPWSVGSSCHSYSECSAQINLAGSQKENRLDVSIRHRFSSSAPDGNDRVAGL